MKADFVGAPSVGAVGYLWRQSTEQEWSQPKREKCARFNNLKGQIHLSPFTSDMETQYFQFPLLDFSLASAQYFLTVLPFLPFGMAICILCPWMLDVLTLFFTRGHMKITLKLRKGFGILNCIEAVKDYRDF